MTIFCVGSINADHFYEVPHLPLPGETLEGANHRVGLGGKGANQSVAAARAGAEVIHVGAVGADGGWAVERLGELGVETSHIASLDGPTGHAIITVAADGENAIVIYPGPNRRISTSMIRTAFERAEAGDKLILQNEASMQVEAAQLAQQAGMQVIYSAAPFDPEAVRAVLEFTDLLVVNDVEARQLEAAFETELSELPVQGIVVTRGSEGVDYIAAGEVTHADAYAVTPRDTTGAGDTFLGYLVAALHADLDIAEALELASAAAALKVTRPGTADAIPSRAEVDAFRAEARRA
ncbi:MAG: ribokinase [Pseudomonadota bacterium]